MGEFDLIDRFFRQPASALLARHPHVALGIGDDCALLAPGPGMQLAVTSDMLVAGRHFFPDADPAGLGHKCLAVNLSDLAAMGARPLGFTLALALPGTDEHSVTSADWLAAFSRGMLALADEAACPLVGGDTTAGPLTIAITAFGEVPASQALRRSGARVGDDVWVSGSPGDARLGLALRRDELSLPSDPETAAITAITGLACARMDRPTPRLALGLALRGLAHSAADVSDGLLADLGHILTASGVGADVNAADALHPSATWGALLARGLVTPEQALDGVLAGGDDYELVFTADLARADELLALSRTLGLPLTRIGHIRAGAGLRVLDEQGQPLAHRFAGFDHFA